MNEHNSRFMHKLSKLKFRALGPNYTLCFLLSQVQGTETELAFPPAVFGNTMSDNAMGLLNKTNSYLECLLGQIFIGQSYGL